MDLIEDLKAVMRWKDISADTMSKYIGCSARQVARWVSGESRPTNVYQKLIRKGIKRAKSHVKQVRRAWRINELEVVAQMRPQSDIQEVKE